MRSSRYILFVLAVVIILGVNVVHAADVIIENGLAIRVENLEIGGTSYTAEFAVQSTANEAYGPFPGVYTFNDEGAATEARNELLMALNAAGAPLIGTPGVPVDGQSFAIGYEGAVILLIESVKTTRAALEGSVSQTYIPLEPNPWEYNFQWKNYVVFSPAGLIFRDDFESGDTSWWSETIFEWV